MLAAETSSAASAVIAITAALAAKLKILVLVMLKFRILGGGQNPLLNAGALVLVPTGTRGADARFVGAKGNAHSTNLRIHDTSRALGVALH